MSDNFDLPWLQDDDDNSSENPPSTPSGVTGQLPWRQLPNDPAHTSDAADDFSLDWDIPSDSVPSQTSSDPSKGLTGMLPWNQAASDSPPPASDDLASWLDADDGQAAPPAEEMPDWLMGAEDELEDSDLNWMTSDGSEFATALYSPIQDEPQSYDEWARQNQEPEAEYEDDLNWMAADTPEMSYDDWEFQQNEDERQKLNPDIPLPDLELSDLGDTGNLADDYMPDWFMGVEELDDADAPDWVKASLGKPVTAPIEEVPLESLFQSPEPAFDELFGGALESETPAWLQDYTPEVEPPDFFGEEISPPLLTDALPDWLSDIEAPPDLDLPEIELPAFEPDDFQDPFDLDSILGTVPTLPPPESALIPTEPDQINSLDDFGFDDSLFGNFAPEAPMEMPLDLLETEEEEEEELLFESEDLPEWMRQVHTSGDEVPIRVGGVEGYFEQVSEVVLGAELRELREVTQSYQAFSPAEQAPEGSILAGVVGGLGLSKQVLDVQSLSTTRAYEPSTEQFARLNAFQQVLEQVQDEEALDKDNALQFSLDHDDEAAALEDLSAPPTAKRRQVKLQKDRIFISILAAVLVILPFFLKPTHLLNEPEAALSADAQPLALAIDKLGPRRVLVAFEYGSAAALELDPLAEAVLRDLFAQEAEVVVISTNPMGILHAQKVLSRFEGANYLVLRFIAGGSVGVRSLRTSDTTSSLFFARDVKGNETKLDIGRVDETDFALVLVIGESLEDVRIWAEQFRILNLPKFLLVSAAAEPFARPYLNAGQYQGLLSGLDGAISYNQVRNQGRIPEVETQGLPDPLLAQWQSVAWGLSVASALIFFGLLLGVIKRRRRRA